MTIFLQGISLANTNCRLERCHRCPSGSWGPKWHRLQLWVDPVPALSCPSFPWRCGFARSWMVPSAICNRIQGGDSGIGERFPLVPPAQRQDSSGAAPSRGWNCSPCVVPRTGLVSLIRCCSAALNLRERKSGCKCSCERSQWWQGNVI